MPLDQAKIKEMKETITLARKRELNFGLCLGKKPETMLLMTHKTKSPAALGKLAKADGETQQFTYGILSADGKDLKLVVEGKIYPGMGRKVREMLKGAGLSMKILVLDPDGNEAESEDSEDETAVAPDQPAATPSSVSAASTDDAPQTGDTAPPDPVNIGKEPSKRDLAEEFAEVRKNLMKGMGQLDSDGQAAVQDQIRQFGELMKAKDFKAAQALMDDLSATQGAVTDPQRIRAREDVEQIDGLVGDIEAELDELEAALNAQEAAA